jgi:hypothetical protein
MLSNSTSQVAKFQSAEGEHSAFFMRIEALKKIINKSSFLFSLFYQKQWESGEIEVRHQKYSLCANWDHRLQTKKIFDNSFPGVKNYRQELRVRENFLRVRNHVSVLAKLTIEKRPEKYAIDHSQTVKRMDCQERVGWRFPFRHRRKAANSPLLTSFLFFSSKWKGKNRESSEAICTHVVLSLLLSLSLFLSLQSWSESNRVKHTRRQ